MVGYIENNFYAQSVTIDGLIYRRRFKTYTEFIRSFGIDIYIKSEFSGDIKFYDKETDTFLHGNEERINKYFGEYYGESYEEGVYDECNVWYGKDINPRVSEDEVVLGFRKGNIFDSL